MRQAGEVTYAGMYITHARIQKNDVKFLYLTLIFFPLSHFKPLAFQMRTSRIATKGKYNNVECA